MHTNYKTLNIMNHRLRPDFLVFSFLFEDVPDFQLPIR